VLQLAALFLVPAGLALALARPTGGRGPADAGSSILGLALFNSLCMLDGLHNNSDFTPRALVAGSLVGIAVNRRRGTNAPRDERRSAREAPPPPPSRPQPPLESALIPMVTATACLLYVFGHGPVAGHEVVKLIGGLGAALLFAAAGAVGAWASSRVPLPRLAWFAGLFAVLGISFNLALHPSSRPVTTADILQGLALSGLAVACWRRWVGAHAWGDAALVALPLLAHFVLRPAVPGFPGMQYLFADPAGERSLFPLFPWLTMAALGARAVGETAAASGAAAVLLAAATALAWWSEPGAGGPVKFPMDLPYALLSCAAIEAAFSLAHARNRLGAAARAAAWLGRNWLIYFYVHFAVVFALGRSGIGHAVAVWALLAAGSLGATWLVAKAAAPLSGVFRSPAAWVVPLALIAAAGGWPGLPPVVVAGLAGCAGLIFAAYHGTLAYLIVNLPSLELRPFRVSSWSRPSPAADSSPRTRSGEREPAQEWERDRSEAPAAVGGGLGRSLVRLAMVLALLALPEAVGYLEGRTPAPPTKGDPPPRPAPETTPTPPPRGGTGDRR
jgi:hypothetical protein